jgi:hypothetical protein
MSDFMNELLIEQLPANTCVKAENVVVLLAGRRTARSIQLSRLRPRLSRCRIVVIGNAEALAKLATVTASGATVSWIDVEQLVSELSGSANPSAAHSAGAELFDRVIERIASEVFFADVVVLAQASVGPAELVAAGAVDALGGIVSAEANDLGIVMSRLATEWKMSADQTWAPIAVASPSVAARISTTLQTALSAPVVVTAGAGRGDAAERDEK